MNKEDVWKFEGKMVEVVTKDGAKFWGILHMHIGKRKYIASVDGIKMYTSTVAEIREFSEAKEEAIK